MRDPGHGDVALDHQLDDVVGDMLAHGVVDAAAGQQDVGVIPRRLCLLDQVIRIDADAVAADQAGSERQEVPLGARGFEHFRGIDPQALADQRELIDQRDVGVALGVLEHLGRFGNSQARGLVRTGRDDAAVKRIDEFGRFRSGPRRYLRDIDQPALTIAGIDAFGAVAHEEVDVVAQV